MMCSTDKGWRCVCLSHDQWVDWQHWYLQVQAAEDACLFDVLQAEGRHWYFQTKAGDNVSVWNLRRGETSRGGGGRVPEAGHKDHQALIRGRRVPAGWEAAWTSRPSMWYDVWCAASAWMDNRPGGIFRPKKKKKKTTKIRRYMSVWGPASDWTVGLMVFSDRGGRSRRRRR